MTAILMSIKPLWCELIANNQKTVEVRKSRPKLEPPFKVYIYCTKAKNSFELLWTGSNDEIGIISKQSNGKVIGEFICNRIYQYSTGNVEGIDISDEDIIKFSCLSKKELCDYEMSAEPKENCVYRVGLYGWHISDLKIYDEPKELSEFSGLRKTRFGYAPVEIKRPPQSWRYVEEVRE